MSILIKAARIMESNLLMVILVLVPFLVSNSASAQHLNISCSDNAVVPYELNSPFHNNLKSLFESLSIKTPKNKGFYRTSSGNGLDEVYGRALCRGDVTPGVCKSCVASASQEIMNNCQKQAAVIWFEKCQIEYSYAMLSTAYTGKYPDLNSEKASDPVPFCNALNNLTANLTKTAGSSELMFATANLRFSIKETLYGLVQCTRDINPGECKTCLNSAFGDLNGCQYSKGGAVLSKTCNVRVELYQFYSESHRNGHKGKFRAPVAVAICAIIFVAALVGLYALCKQRRTKAQGDEENSQSPVLQDDVAPITHALIKEESSILTTQDLPFMKFSIIKAATDNFSDSYKLGQGGFGTVYKGVLPDGKEVAVKRLSRRSWQGSEEFTNEIRIIAKLQHRNLVRLLCCSLEGNEKLLIYEYVPNRSLDLFLFDNEKRLLLDWKKRIDIISGIARGLLYLHEESRLKIVHRDLKPSNVLLDHEMTAKISDFGMARIFCDKQDLANTKRVVGTYGYMAPEYAMEGLFSVKSDVFSFGVILLEIISGKRNSGFHLTEHAQTLLAYAWWLWNEGQELDLVDPTWTESCPMQEVGRCIHIGLLCVQEDPAERPTMSQVVVLLESKLMALPEPNKPAFSVGRVVRQAAATTHRESSSTTEPSMSQVTISSIAPR
ncbi:hypothetical protein Pfo_013069 [Paulownia fortunei]|nr:hypothetical protein Pfo_013069 [Paulownia fortunei]